MQFSQIWGEVASNFPTANQARCKQAVNWAYHEWLSARQWSFRESSMAAIALVAGTSTFKLLGTTPVVTDFDGMIDVVLVQTTGGSEKPLIELLQADFDRVGGHCKVNSAPIFWTVRGGAPNTSSATLVQGGQQELAICPPPIATAGNGVSIIIRYFRSVGTMEMVADADIPILPTQYHAALAVGGNAYMAEALGNAQKAQGWRTLFQQRVAEAISADTGARGHDRQLMVFAQGPSIYPITGQTPQTYDKATRPYDLGQ